MNFTDIIVPALILAAMGLIFGLALAFASKKFHVEKDPRIAQVREALPGANCGGCGFAGCDALAGAIVAGQAPVNGCTVGGAASAKKIAEIMGVDTVADEPKVAFVRCQGALGGVKLKADYSGVADCAAAADVAGGPISCRFACLGMGTCERACPFDAIKVKDGLAVVDREKCTGCGVCVSACPRGVIEMIPKKASIGVACRNTDSGKAVREICSRGCIACGICEKKCGSDAIKVEGGISKVNYENCAGCGTSVESCPTKCIVSFSKKPE